MPDKRYHDQLIAFADKLLKCGLAIIEDGGPHLLNGNTKDPKFISFLFLCRTMSNFRNAVRLAQQKMIVEARILTRCCYENMFFMERLHGEGAAFVDKMWDTEVLSKRLRLSFMLENEELKVGVEPHILENIQATVARLKGGKPKAKMLRPKGVATAGEVAHAYLAYSVLSGDAAHPTFEALERHLSKGEDGVTTIDVQPVAKPSELAETIFLACTAMLGALVTTNQSLGPLKAGEDLPGLAEEFQRTGDVRKGEFPHRGQL